MNTRRITMTTLGGLALAGILATAAPATADSYDSGQQHWRGSDSDYGPQHWRGGDRAFQSGARARINQRQQLQAQRIQHGLNTGALTQREFRILDREQATIRQMEANALADRFLSRAEVQQIEHAQDVANQNIQRFNHNDRVARYR